MFLLVSQDDSIEPKSKTRRFYQTGKRLSGTHLYSFSLCTRIDKIIPRHVLVIRSYVVTFPETVGFLCFILFLVFASKE